MEYALNILVVDDDKAMARSIESVLNTQRYKVQTVHSALTALEKIKEGVFDLVLLDVMMPEMTGFQLIDALDRSNLDTYFIIMTGDSSMESAVEAIRRGASDYLKKPFEPDELLIRVENIIKQKQLRSEHIRVEGQKKQLEMELYQSQKMEAIGTLAGGIAHDFNNILSIILGNSELALDSLQELDPIRQNLEQIFTAANRAKEITYQLLSFCRKGDSKQHPLNLNTIIGESLKLMRASLPTNIEIRQNLLDGSHAVLGDATQIHQIMINLCTNAAHAMQDKGGRIEVSLKNVTLEPSHDAQYKGLPPGNYIKMIVSDTGHGINPQIMDQIFDPYFTTKDVGKGTGMGLSLVRGIVKSHGGEIRVDSKPGEFTNINILLPVIDEAELATDGRSSEIAPRGDEKVLIVDDEEMIVDILTQLLSQLGYQTVSMTDSSKALEAFRIHPDAYDLVISDMTMPKLTGIQLAQKMRKIRPDIPIIICSGYSEQISIEKSKKYGIQAFIMKPVIMNDMAKTIRDVLDGNNVDRRKDKRFKAMTGAFIISKAGSKSEGKVLDISRSGLSFKYAFEGKMPANMNEATVNMMADNFSLDDLTYRAISDTMLRNSNGSTGETRRRGVLFEKLTPIQSEQLDFFIRNYTEGSIN
jgi:DNA-binding response OmpR family regulator/anti-sigma regulatory factor (Ser/Thr protein kinase)